MSVAANVVEVQINDVAASVAEPVALQTYDLAWISVRYGDESKIVAILNTDYTLALSVDFNTVTVTPTASLITKITDLGEANAIFVRRTLPLTTDITENDVQFREKIVEQFDKLHMISQQQQFLLDDTAAVAEDVILEARDEAVLAATAAAASATAAAASETAAETAADVASTASKVYADTTAGLAATASGDYFWVPSGDASESLILYLDNAGVAVEQKRLPSTEALNNLWVDPATATTRVRRRPFPVTVTNVVLSAMHTYSWSTGTATFIADFPLTPSDIIERDAGRDITIRCPASGTFSDSPDIQQMTAIGGSTIDSRTNMTLVGNEYVYTLTLDPSCGALRLRWGATTTASVEHPYFVYEGEYVVDEDSPGWQRQTELWAHEIAKQSGDLFNSLGWGRGVGSGDVGLSSPDCRLFSANFDTRMDGVTYVHGLLSPSEQMIFIIELLETNEIALRNFQAQGHTGDPGGSGSARQAQYSHGRLFMIQNTINGVGGVQAKYMDVQVDRRNGTAGVVLSEEATVRVRAVLKGPFDPRRLTNMDALERALAARRSMPATVSPAAIAGVDNYYQTLQEAVVHGHRDIRLSYDVFRMAAGLAIPQATRIYAKRSFEVDNALLAKPRICASTAIDSGDVIDTVADANVKYYATAFDPGALFEVVTATAVATRMGVDNLSGATLKNEAANEAAVQANAGAWWFGTGSEGQGIYFRPYGDTMVGKEYEVATWENVLRARNVELTLEGVDIRYAAGDALYVQGGALYTQNIEVGRCGNNGCQLEAGAFWQDEDSLATDATNDGWGTNSTGTGDVHWHLKGTRGELNNNDGFAPHGDFVEVQTLAPIIAKNNGKQGFVTIVAGNFDLDIESHGNRDVDILIRLGAVSRDSTVKSRIWKCGSSEITHNTATKVVAELGRVEVKQRPAGVGLNVQGVVTVDYLYGDGEDGAGNISAQELCKVDGTNAVLTVKNGYGKRFTTLFNLDNPGTLKLLGGNWLRSTLGISQEASSTLELQADNPANFYGNTSNFSGVSAPDQAKTVSIAAV